MKAMLVNTLSRTEKLRSQLMTTTTDESNLFATVLNQLLVEKFQSTIQSQVNTLEPDTVTAMNPSMIEQFMPISTGEPLRFQSINPEKINQVLGGKLTGMGEIFVRAGQKYNINPALITAIAQHETGNGKSRAASEKNNIAGMMGINGLKSYTSIEDSIMDMARNLSKNYLGSGLSSISKIGAKYAPIGAENDPTALNNHWVTGVTKHFDQLRV
jgi:beta-N-acetylglucosaminidase